jgi:RNA polymerase sigma factor (sigma-70 family)
LSYPRLIEWSDLSVSRQKRVIQCLVEEFGTDPWQAEDIVSDAVLRLMNSRPMVMSSPFGLLKRTAMNVLYANHARNRSKPEGYARELSARIAELGSAGELADERADPATEAAEREAEIVAHGRLGRALGRLPADVRADVDAYYFEERRLTDLDRERGAHEGTAKTHLHRARERLRRAWLDSKPQPDRTR